jgi:FkbM family methyltransferase
MFSTWAKNEGTILSMRLAYYTKVLTKHPSLSASFTEGVLRVFRARLKERVDNVLVAGGEMKASPFRSTILVDTREVMQRQMRYGVYSIPIEKVLRKLLSKDSVFYDVGSHIGYFSGLAASICQGQPSVFAFEPNPERRKALDVLASHSHGRIKCFPVALGDKHQGVEIDGAKGNTGMSQVSGLSDSEEKQVQMHTLDQFVEDQSLAFPDVVKVDVEGYEGFFLAGAVATIKRAKPYMVMEVNLDSEYFSVAKEHLDRLVQMNYKAYTCRSLGKEVADLDNLASFTGGNASLDIVLVPDTRWVYYQKRFRPSA